ncbi:MAG: hypothetical protein V7664_13650 [Qipengyuania sp.]|uniref:hypothetical protein n=1 Tax=Qipengyuania sp. TaxID=2004515 RepID=UPI0030017E52
MTETDQAAAEALERASEEIAGSIAELIAAARDRGEDIDLSLMTSELIACLLASTWKLAIFGASGDRTLAARQYSALLYRLADRTRKEAVAG